MEAGDGPHTFISTTTTLVRTMAPWSESHLGLTEGQSFQLVS